MVHCKNIFFTKYIKNYQIKIESGSLCSASVFRGHSFSVVQYYVQPFSLPLKRQIQLKLKPPLLFYWQAGTYSKCHLYTKRFNSKATHRRRHQRRPALFRYTAQRLHYWCATHSIWEARSFCMRFVFVSYPVVIYRPIHWLVFIVLYAQVIWKMKANEWMLLSQLFRTVKN